MANLYSFEKRIVEAEMMDIEVYEEPFESNMKGYYIDNIIVISKALSWKEKNCILAEEIGHALYTAGNIIDQSNTSNRKQERQARIYAYKKVIPLDKLIEAYKYGCANRYEAAEYLNATEDFFDESIRYYYEHCGRCIAVGEYTVYFSQNSVYIKKEGMDICETA